MTTTAAERTFEATLPSGKVETFTYQDYLDYRNWLGMPVAKADHTSNLQWLESDNLSRVSVYLGLEMSKRAKATG